MPREDRRIHILQSAAHIFLERGFDATSMNEVAERAGVTKPGLYYHFDGKRELLYAIMSYAMDVLERDTGAAAAAATTPEGRLRGILHAHARLMVGERESPVSILVIDEIDALEPPRREEITARKRAYFDSIRGSIEELAAAGELRPVDPTTATFSLLGMVMWLVKWYEPGGRLGSEEVAAQVTELAMGAVLRPVADPVESLA